MLTVACVRIGEKYGEDYVRKLLAMVARHLSVPHRFRVVRDPPKLPGADGCWSKLWMFDPSFADGPVLYFDLDVVISGPIDNLVSDGPFRAMLDPRVRPDGGPKLNSSVMSWVPGAASRAVADAHRRLSPRGKPGGEWRGDQEFIETHIGTWEPLPGVHSYKGGISLDTTVAVFHGTPKPHEVADVPYVAAHWR